MSPWPHQAKPLLSTTESRFFTSTTICFFWFHIALPITFSLFMINRIHTLDKQPLAYGGGEYKAVVPLNS
jgi:hypothetical protein